MTVNIGEPVTFNAFFSYFHSSAHSRHRQFRICLQQLQRALPTGLYTRAGVTVSRAVAKTHELHIALIMLLSRFTVIRSITNLHVHCDFAYYVSPTVVQVRSAATLSLEVSPAQPPSTTVSTPFSPNPPELNCYYCLFHQILATYTDKMITYASFSERRL
jgi:hypothetical protein